jgi:mRNA-degrading endonuclease RelE of RelBE toxin-antitoxin system
MKVIQSKLFEQKLKKLNKDQKLQLDEIIREILNNPEAGEQKKGDLKQVFIHKFKINQTLHLLAYRFSPDVVELIMFGTHANYYKNLKNYLRSR